MMEMKYTLLAIFTSLLVSAAFHLFTINQVKNWFEKFFNEEEKRMKTLLNDIKKQSIR